MRILLLSSDLTLRLQLQRHLAGMELQANVEAPDPVEALRSLSAFDAEWRRWLSGGLCCPPEPPFKGVDLLISDETLLSEGRRREIAPWIWALRASGQAAAFVAISSDRRSVFDTAHLRRSCGPFDLLISADDLLSEGLWSGDGRPGVFCPWVWPVLSDLPNRRASQIAELAAALHRPTGNLFRIPRSVEQQIASQHASLLSTALDVRVDLVTPWDVLRTGAMPIEIADRTALIARLQMDQRSGDRDIAARLLAPVLEQWLETAVLDQPIAFDAPRFLQSTGLPLSAHARLRVSDICALRSGEAITLMFQKGKSPFPITSHWSARAWLPVSELVTYAEELEYSGQMDRSFVFCDDTCRFVRREDHQDFAYPKRISPDIGPGIPVRWIEGGLAVDYLPRAYVSA